MAELDNDKLKNDELLELAITTLNRTVKNDRYLAVRELTKSLGIESNFVGGIERYIANWLVENPDVLEKLKTFKMSHEFITNNLYTDTVIEIDNNIKHLTKLLKDEIKDHTHEQYKKLTCYLNYSMMYNEWQEISSKLTLAITADDDMKTFINNHFNTNGFTGSYDPEFNDPDYKGTDLITFYQAVDRIKNNVDFSDEFLNNIRVILLKIYRLLEIRPDLKDSRIFIQLDYRNDSLLIGFNSYYGDENEYDEGDKNYLRLPDFIKNCKTFTLNERFTHMMIQNHSGLI